MGKIKQLTNIAAATVASVFGIASFAGNASAANTMEMRYDSSASAMQICKTVNGLQGPHSATYTYNLTYTSSTPTSYVDLRGVAASGTGVSYSSNSADAGILTIAIDNNGGTSSTASNCATVNFSGAFTNTNMVYGEYGIHISESNTVQPGDTNIYYYATDPEQDIAFNAYLDVDSTTGEPIEGTTSDTYGIMIKAKAPADFESTASYVNTHITLKKQVKGNMADPQTKYDFTVQLKRKFPVSSSSQTVHISVPGDTNKTCVFSSSNANATCTATGIKLAHNDIALIGIDNNTEELVAGGYEYTITENLTATSAKTEAFSDLTGQTSVQTWNSGETGTRPITVSDLGNDDKWLFVNTLSEGSPAGRFFMILPFVILAIIAGGSVVVLRKTSKKEA